MKYWDASALLRAWKEGWAPRTGLTRPHTVAEWIAIQTGRGLVYRTPKGQLVKRNLSPADAAKEAKIIFARLTFCDLSGEEILSAAESAGQKASATGGGFHDFLHARAAELHRATSIVTINLHDFARMTGLPLELPTRES